MQRKSIPGSNDRQVEYSGIGCLHRSMCSMTGWAGGYRFDINSDSSYHGIVRALGPCRRRTAILLPPRKASGQLFEIRAPEANILFLVRELEKAVASGAINWSPGLVESVRTRLIAVVAKIPEAKTLSLAAD